MLAESLWWDQAMIMLFHLHRAEWNDVGDKSHSFSEVNEICKNSRQIHVIID
jgi:hypothetical protein